MTPSAPPATPPPPGPPAPATPRAPRPRAPGGARLKLLLRDRFAPPAHADLKGARGLVVRARSFFEASPGYAFAAFVHLLVLVILSFISVAVAVQQHASRPVEVRLVAQSELELAPVDDVKALDDVPPPDLDALAEVDTDDPFQEALGASIGHLQGAAGNAIGLAGGGGAGRGGNRYGVGGASSASDGALRAGLDWLVRHQSADGGWNFIPGDHAVTGRIAANGEVGRTSLALLCFLCAGEGPEREGPYQETVARAIAWLTLHTHVTGEVGGRFSGYEQSVAILALAEAFARAPSPKLEKTLRRAVACLEGAQDPTNGGWRYRPLERADTSVTCWSALGLKAAEHAGVEVRPETWAGVRTFVESVSKEDGVTTYMTNHARAGPGMVASGLFLRLMLGEAPTTPRNHAATGLTAAIADKPLGDIYATYYGALAMYQVGGEVWRAFNPKVRDALVAAIEGGTGCERGSWSEGGHWMRGDVMLATAFSILTLETYYRYLPVHEGGGQARRLLAEAQTPGQKLFARACALLDEALRNDEAGLALAAEAAVDEAAAALEREDDPTSRDLRRDILALRVLTAAATKDGAAILSRSDAYLAALAPTAWADLDVLRARRAALLERAVAVAREGAASASSEPDRAGVEQRLAAIEDALRADVGRCHDGESRVAAEAAVTELATLRRRMALSLSPDLAIADAQRALPPPTSEPATHDEVLLLQAVLQRASRLLAGPARSQRSALDRAEADLDWVAGRAPETRVPLAERAQLERARCQAGVLRLAALHAHGRTRDLLVAAAPLRPRMKRLGDATLLDALEALERSALMERLERGEADEHEEARLLDMVLTGPLGPQGERPLSWVAVGELMLAREQPDQARRCAERALACEPAPTQDEAARARLLRARAALHTGDLPSADEDVASLERLGLADRVDVRLARAALLRARSDHEAALKRYQEVVRALDAERPAPWWEAVEGITATYVDMQDWPRARRFLADLNRRDPTFGGDAVRKRRLVSLMGWLDAQR